MSKRYESWSANCGRQFPHSSSTKPENPAKGQAKKANREIMQTTKQPKVNSTKKQQLLNKNRNSKKETSEENNKSHDHTAIVRKGHQHPTPKEEQKICFNTGNLITIWNYKPLVWNSNSDAGNVIALAKRMGLSITRDDIIDMDVYTENQNFLVYDVYFCSKHVKESFLEKSYVLKEFPETKSIVIY